MNRNVLVLFFVLLPSVAFSQLKKGEALERLRENDEKFQEMVKEKRDAYIDLLERAKEADVNEKPLSVILLTAEALETFDLDSGLFYLRGRAFAQLSIIDQAVENYKKALELNPFDLPLLAELIEVNYYAGNYKEALKWLQHMEKVIDLDVKMSIPAIFDFKKLICLEKLEVEGEDIAKLRKKYSYLDDTPYYFYSNALKQFKNGKKKRGWNGLLKLGMSIRKTQKTYTAGVRL